MAGMAQLPDQLQTWHGSEESKKKQQGDMLYTCILKLGSSGTPEYQQ